MGALYTKWIAHTQDTKKELGSLLLIALFYSPQTTVLEKECSFQVFQ